MSISTQEGCRVTLSIGYPVSRKAAYEVLIDVFCFVSNDEIGSRAPVFLQPWNGESFIIIIIFFLFFESSPCPALRLTEFAPLITTHGNNDNLPSNRMCSSVVSSQTTFVIAFTVVLSVCELEEGQEPSFFIKFSQLLYKTWWYYILQSYIQILYRT